MLTEIFRALYLIRPQPAADGQTGFTYLLRRPAGNILLATKADISSDAAAIAAVGGVSRILLGDRHHAGPHTVALAQHFGVPLSASRDEAKALAGKGIPVTEVIPYQRADWADDLAVLPTPGHTKGALSYLWHNGGQRYLFIGDTLVPVDGGWDYWVTAIHRAQMQRTVLGLTDVAFDVILSNSFAARPVAWLAVDADQRQALLQEVAARLAG